jgi:acyl transferase domain-containing protein/NADPH:quinone reductase-like Zn-dependent oxidoreductase/acyl carrier protein
MDPQQRLFLEVAIEALDRAGLSREKLAGSLTGVFVASYFNDYQFLQASDPEAIDERTLTGMLHSVLANRLSYLLDLRGPSVSVDTACSSSLVAVHLACQSLRIGDSDAAVAAGVSLMLAPEMMIAMSKVGFMSPTGRCRTFDSLADGFIRGEGCGVVVLKRLADAIADNDPVLAVVRGSAINQDGHSTVLAAPNGLAQQALVRTALANAQIAPERVGFVETHGTGTPLGDPIEVEALAATVGAPRADGSLCYLGSAKANLGHLEAAAGVAGLIKATLALQHGEIPRQPHYTKLNPHLSFAGTALAVADRHLPWPAGPMPRVAGVSGFGVGGTNAHVVVEEAPALPAPAATDSADEPRLLPLSAQSPAALQALAERWAEFLPASTESVARIAATAGARRSHYDHRLALVGRTCEQLADQLRAFAAGEETTLAVGRRPRGGSPRLAFVFSGQGPQSALMGRELAEREPAFREALNEVDARFRQLAGWSVAEAIAEPAETSRLQETEVAQPAIFAVQVALARLWESWGVRPDAVVGHSIGELAALHVAGVLSLDDAVRIVWHRGRIMQRATGNGRMTAAGLTAEEGEALAREIGPALSLAAINGPRSVVLAGTPEAVEAATAKLDARGVQHRALPVSYAFHSAQMAPFQAELVAAIGAVTARPAHVAVYSTVTGAAIDHTAIDAAYFGRNLRETVRFAPAIDALLATGVDAFVELAPHPVLGASVAESAAAQELTVPVLASMRRGRPERETMLQAAAGVYAAGRTPRWEAIAPLDGPPAELPSYPWQRERYWLRERPRMVTAPAAPTVGTADGQWPAVGLEWLADHVIAGRTLMPAAALVESLRDTLGAPALADFVVHHPLLLDAPGGTRWRTTLVRDGGEPRAELHTLNAAGETDLLIASARRAERSQASEIDAVAGEWRYDADVLYDAFTASGVSFGPTFRTITRWRSAGRSAEAWLRLSAPPTGDGVHPTLLDGTLQLCVLAASAAAGRELPTTVLLPLAVESYTVHRPAPARVRAVAQVAPQAHAGASIEASVRVFDEDGALVATLDGARFAPADAAALAALAAGDDSLYEVRWQPVLGESESRTPIDATGAWLVLAADDATGRALVASLTAAGGRCRQIHPQSSADFDGLQVQVADSAWRGGLPLRGIVHAWSLADGSDDAARGDWLITGSALALVQALGRSTETAPLWLVTRGAQPAGGAVAHPRQAGLWGFANVVAAEYADLPCHAFDLDPIAAPDDVAALVGEITRQHAAPRRIALRGTERYTPRLARYRADGGQSLPEHARLTPSADGTLDALAWEPDSAPEPGTGEVQLRVLAAGVNFRDVLIALGMYPGAGAMMGAECAGLVEQVGAGVESLHVGDVAFGFAPKGLATDVTLPAHFLTKVPDGLRVEQAATLPAAFLTALYGLRHVADIKRGTRVLIHAAAGGVGMAAVQIAQRAGAEVFATAGSPAKRALLRRMGVAQVFDSRSLAFRDELLAATGGRGVDVVLNSLAGEFIPASVATLAPDGWFLELGKRDVWSPERMRETRPDVRYRIYDLGEELSANPKLAPALLGELCAALADGSLRPLPVRAFDFAQAPEAFRFMAQAHHVGKLVLRAPGAARRAAAGAPLVRPDATYWITGGTGGIGVRTARWLVQQGARDVVLTGRREPSADAQHVIEECMRLGARIHVRAADAGVPASVAAVLDEIRMTMPPLRGVVHAAGVLEDGVLAGQTWPRWQAVLRGKAHGAHLLDALTRDLPLDFFVLYSAAGLQLGPAGQGAYPAANAELDALAWARRSAGLPALSVAWGQWAEAGMAARTSTGAGAGGADAWSARGLGWIAPREGFAQLARLLRDGATYAAVLPIDWARFLTRLPAGIDRDFYRAVAPAERAPARAEPTTATRAAEGVSLVERWRAAPAGDRRGLMLAHLADRARHVLGLDAGVPLDPRGALKDAGLDSLMSVELRNVLTRSLGRSLPATLLFDYPSLDALASYLLRALDLSGDAPPPSDSASARPVAERPSADDVAALSDEEAEALLLAELDGQP